ncbi:uncharacterized protein BO88DRAFT_473416 [Aspergillus vadensis CBS 113365]|uniref:Uncharacterized protein n=1 Tax=Aspergillus vadensis (strain CBS 113365 / IMI 142717 / IBT 24658) TaxID=1448311 RepID=A0A319BJD1_ASPVC|nr:hypothetical protein BO88DRAFT_473416 [Aspergillus vadensis CBS 113365]PYH72747.1 hypothetical protein BO88DRAFT_473416 [Aspergillus vadensis CBS 113365]
MSNHYITRAVHSLSHAETFSEALKAINDAILSIYDSSDTLFVIVYEGHSNAYYDIPNACVSIMGSAREPTVSLPWGFVETALAFTDGDVIFILDSPFPSRAALNCEDIEYLVVSAFRSPAARGIDVSLTRRLIDLLNQVDTEITLSQIHAKLTVHANRPDSQLGLIPVHFPAKYKPSITLRPLGARPRQLRGLRKADDLSDGKVLVTVRISDTTSVPDIVEQCIQCLSESIAEDVADIKIEGVFKFSPDSSLLLLTMPTAVWSMLRHNHSFDFVGVVQSHNLLSHRSTSTTQPLPLASGNSDLPYRGKN